MPGSLLPCEAAIILTLIVQEKLMSEMFTDLYEVTQLVTSPGGRTGR